MTSVTIKLDNPFTHANVLYESLTLKEPSGYLFIELGEPRIPVSQSNGGGYWVEQPVAIKAYFERCLDHPAGVAALAFMSLADAVKLKSALFDFFRAASASVTDKP
jgi:hypothetical protein